MSGTRGMELEKLGQDALRMAHSLLAPAPVPASLPTLDGLCTDPAECLNALFAPLMPFIHKTAASSPQPPESTAEPSRDAPPIRPRTRQAERDATIAESPGVVRWADNLHEAPPETRTALPPVPIVFSPPAMPVPFPMQADASPQQAAGTAQSENPVSPDALTTLRDLTALARASLTLPATKGKHGPRKPEDLTVSGPAAPETAVPRSPDALAELFARSLPALPVRNADEDRNNHRRNTRLPFLQSTPSSSDGTFSLRQDSAEQDGSRQANRSAMTPTVADQTGAEIAPAPLRLMRGASPLAAMLQAHVQALPLDNDLLPAPFAPCAASAVQKLATLPQALPINAPHPDTSPDMEALIQALEAHLEFEFLRTYGTSGR